MNTGNLGTVYILHLLTPLGHAQHYVGYANDFAKRLYHHRHNSGSAFTRACNERGIQYVPAVKFAGTRADERRLKNTNNTRLYCPFCTTKPRQFHARVLPHEVNYQILYDGKDVSHE